MTPWRGNLILAVRVVLGFIVGSLGPPAGLDVQGWRLLVLFLMAIVGVILSPKPLSVIALLGGLVAVLTHVLPLTEILQEFSSKVVWLVVLAFFIAQGFVKTGLGRRVAFTLTVQERMRAPSYQSQARTSTWLEGLVEPLSLRVLCVTENPAAAGRLGPPLDPLEADPPLDWSRLVPRKVPA